LNHHY